MCDSNSNRPFILVAMLTFKDLISHPTKVIEIPSDTVTGSNNAPPNLTPPPNFTVDLSFLHTFILSIVEMGAI